MSRKCFKQNLVKKLESQKIRPGKEQGAAYTKRSLELIEEGWKGSVVFDEAGDIAGAAAYELFEGAFRVETLGSIGKFETGVTPGMSLLYDIMKQAGDKDVVLYSTPNAVDFYEKYHFKSEGPDGRRMRAKNKEFQPFLKWFESKTEGKKKFSRF